MTTLNDKITVKELRGHVTALNAFMAENGMGIKIATKMPKNKLSIAFLGAMAEIAEAKKLDDVPDEIYTFYETNAVGANGKENGTGGQSDTANGDDAATTEGETGAADTETKPVQDKPATGPTHAGTFMVVMEQIGTGAPFTRDQWLAAYEAGRPGTSKNEVNFRWSTYIAIATALGIVVKGTEKGTFEFVAYTIDK
jgi:hypothetical protein